ncbi:hypothetical protein Dsin_026626 [Dipteronia sinensis]|uniref:HVA22-like protein n=1 Tax=Dipteronia sinensis TaxID=43782 RepID=A0AAE0DYA1_9ROSI|nr:hypothetical protein Dsin_026626 [Dipteronia sinensis]
MIMGSFLSRALIMAFGYAYPAYQCFKAVEKMKNKPETEHLLFWCHYWILVAMFSVSERLGDTFISWLPMYNEAKLAFLIYLWYPKTKGTTYVYNSWVKPFFAKHETEIDCKLLEMNVKASEIGVLIWQKTEGYGQTRFFEIMHYFSSRSLSSSRDRSDLLLLDSANNDGTNQKQSSEHFLPDSLSESLSRKKHEEAQEEAGDLLLPTASQSNKKVTPDQTDSTEATGLVETRPIDEPVLISSPESRNRNSSKQVTVSKRFFRQKCGKWRIFRAAEN